MSEFTDYLADVFAQFGEVNARPMFGGHGLYHNECMFGLVADDTLYLKVDEQNQQTFIELDLPAFEYEKSDGKVMAMSFMLAPETIYEDPDDAEQWARRSFEAAFRAKARKKPKGKKKTTKKKTKKVADNSKKTASK